MWNFNKVLSTKKITKGTNTNKFIIVHHTAGGTFAGNCALLSTGTSPVSCHFIVGPNGETCKIGDPKQIMWHAGVSEWKGLKDLNNHSLGIEVVSDGVNFTRAQYVVTIRLIEYLMAVFKIPKENVLRHKDIAPKRKNDIGDNFWNKEFKTWSDFQKSLTANANQ